MAATGTWAWLNELAAYDKQKNAGLPNTQPAAAVTPATQPRRQVKYMDEAARQRIAAGLSIFGFGSLYTDRGRNDQKGASIAGVKVAKPVVLGTINPLKPGGLTTNAGMTAVGLQTSLATGKPIGTVLR